MLRSRLQKEGDGTWHFLSSQAKTPMINKHQGRVRTGDEGLPCGMGDETFVNWKSKLCFTILHRLSSVSKPRSQITHREWIPE